MTSNAQVAHVWAQQTKDEGKGSSFYFRGDTIYSFGGHFPIATFTDEFYEGQRVVLFTIENGWGGYTGRHIQHTRGALRGLPVVILECLEPAARNGRHNSRQLSQEQRHAANLADYEARYSSALQRASRARLHGEMYMLRAEEMRDNCVIYCMVFELPFPQWVKDVIPADLSAIRARAAQAAKEASARKREKMAREVADWRAGASVSLYDHPDTMLRLSRNGRTVETSRGAVVPVDDARALWAIVARCQREGRSLETRGMPVGNFELERISASGECKVGCHTIPFNESRAFAIAQGWEI